MTAQRKSSQGDEAPEQRGKTRLAGLRGLVEAFRRMPAALRRPETLMLVMAILASFGAHMPPYLGLGALAEYWEEQEAEKEAAEPVEVSFEWNEPPEADEPEPPKPEPEPEDRDEPKPREEPEREKKKVAEKKKPEPEAEPEKKAAELAVKPPPPPPPPKQQRKQSITQKSPDPDVEPPPDARFLAEESRVVEEETVAMVRDEARDDPEPEAAAPQDRGVDEAGDARENEEEIESFNERGRDEGDKLVEARVAQPPERAEGPAETHAPGRERRAAQAEVAPSTPAPGTVIKDPMGSFTIATAEEPRERQRARRAQEGGRSGPRGSGQPNLAVSWQTFEDTFDAEELERERTPQRRTNVGSSQRKQRMKEFRAAAENYVVGARPGNTTALNAAADPFAGYIAAFHRHLHYEFAYEFLQSLPATGELGDPNLMTKVEMVINPDGTLDRVGIVRSSGHTLFDLGAFNAVKNGEPYPRPPEKIRSPDGKVYLQWALHRNHSQCGTWNAQPFIVKNPPDVGGDGMGRPPGMQLGPTRRGPG